MFVVRLCKICVFEVKLPANIMKNFIQFVALFRQSLAQGCLSTDANSSLKNLGFVLLLVMFY